MKRHDIPFIEILFWIISLVVLLAVWIMGSRLSDNMLLLLWTVLGFSFVGWHVWTMTKSKFELHLFLIKGKPQSIINWSDIDFVLKEIHSGNYNVTIEDLRLLESFRRSLYCGIFVIVLFFLGLMFLIHQ